MRHVNRPSFRLGRFDGHEQITIPARRFSGQLLGLAACLVTWPLLAFTKLLGGVIAGGWKAGLFLIGATLFVVLVFAVLQIIWWLVGSERISVIGTDLLVRHTILSVPVAARSYRGAEIRFLAPTSYMPPTTFSEPSVPFLGESGRGALKFWYRGSTIYIAHDLLAADAAAVVDWLAERLPSGAVETVL
ncbi:hypothetical protein RHAL1_01990 [Beijerinckiaceae bacterium RH AL1]|nr:hypothetical protein [Beijerinckiaceae bacterium]VVB45859.1 hypothetical protein RHCH11_RHCH11_01951 [Beijerinckiaceae bacterium RH CH11]VVB45937.1 hypothetical protein RHAL8_01947 [Beijerinckiaceae bacterium RH AL8]VVC55077.1 hypothetical protein RHAL1_01990 [Beijerinckiaceae bacterium RH AL1]